MSSDRGKLGNFLNEVIGWNWLQFCLAEKDPNYTGVQAVVFSLVRTCSEGKLGAIRSAIDRVDGKLETPVKIEYPKVWLLFPYAEKVALPGEVDEPAALPSAETLPAVASPVAEEPEQPQTAATLTLRQMVDKMADQPKEVVPLILAIRREIEFKLKAGEQIQDSDQLAKKIPLVKSVIAANLLHLAIEKNNFEAITEVFDQIDGKLVETIKILADDVYLTQYALEAPPGAVKNKNGVYMIEAKKIAETWREKLKKN